MSRGDLRYGIIGCGGISSAHFKALSNIEGVTVTAAADVNPAMLAQRTAEFAVERAYADWQELVADPAIDAVSICVPHHLHHPMALAAAAAGKHIFVEKPMALTLAHVDEMLAAAARSGVVLAVGQVVRRYPACKLARQWIAEGRLGRVSSVQHRRVSYGARNLEAYSWSSKPEIAGGWLLYGYGAHEYDLVLWLLDAMPVSAYAAGNKVDPRWNDYDEIAATLRLDNGAFAAVAQSLQSRAAAWDTVIVGSEATLYLQPTKAASLNGVVTEAPVEGADAFEEQLREFVEAIASGTTPSHSGQSVRRTMAALEAVKRSLASGQVEPAEAR